MPSKDQIKKIHALKGALGLDDETYRSILSGYGVASSTKLSFARADQLIADLEAKAITAGRWEKRPPRPRKHTRTLADDPQSRKIRALWLELHQAGAVRDPSEKALGAYVKRMTGVAALQWLTAAQACTVIEALKKWQERQP